MPNPPTLCETKVLRMTKPNGQFLFFFFFKERCGATGSKKKKKKSPRRIYPDEATCYIKQLWGKPEREEGVQLWDTVSVRLPRATPKTNQGEIKNMAYALLKCP